MTIARSKVDNSKRFLSNDDGCEFFQQDVVPDSTYGLSVYLQTIINWSLVNQHIFVKYECRLIDQLFRFVSCVVFGFIVYYYSGRTDSVTSKILYAEDQNNFTRCYSDIYFFFLFFLCPFDIWYFDILIGCCKLVENGTQLNLENSPTFQKNLPADMFHRNVVVN